MISKIDKAILNIILFFFLTSSLNAQNLGRVLVLELQGEEVPSQIRMQWSDTLRSLVRQHYPQFQLISKDAIVMLLPPGESLNDCIGVCESEISRKVGANWAIGGQLVKDILNADSKSWVLTLKLHHADGTLVGVEQRQGRLQDIQKNLELQLKAVARNLELIALQDQPQSSKPQSIKVVEDYHLVNQSWQFLEKNQVCISALINASDYQACVLSKTCTLGETGGRCVFESQSQLKDLLLPMNCVDFNQAQKWISWTQIPQARLPLESEWHELSQVCPKCQSAIVSEWTAQVYREKTDQVQLAQPKNPLTDPNILIRGGDRLGSKLRDQMPPSFSHSKLGFRIVFPAKNADDCQKAQSKIQH